MKLLAVETTTDACSAATLVGEEIVERYEIAPRGHAGLILPMIEAVLAEAGIGLAELDALAFGRGPGSFTGVRVGTGVVQGIALARDLPVVPVSTLAAIARGMALDLEVARVAVAMDARMGEVYWGAYEVGGDGVPVLQGEERVCAPGAVPLPEGGGWQGTGSGWDAHAEVLCRRLGILEWEVGRYPRAGEVAMLGGVGLARGEALPPEHARPVYLRHRVAAVPGAGAVPPDAES